MDESIDSITLQNNIPVVPYSSFELLSKSERQLSKFFKCCPKESIDSENKCYWSGNDVQKFKQHIQTSHQNVFCSYCLSDKEQKEPFGAEDVDQLIAHLIESHGRRIFQCNRCQYRANTWNHTQMHQMTIHYPIWAKNNSTISSDFLSDLNSDICKIIVCKAMVSDPNVDHSLLISKFSPNLDLDLAPNLFYCLFCDYCNEEEMKVLMHCVNKHKDFDLSVYHRECQKDYCFDESEPEVITESDDSDFDEPKEQTINGTKSLVNNFESQLSIQNQSIPGIDDGFNSRKPFDRFSKYEKCTQRFENRFQKRGSKRKESLDSYFEDDFEVSLPSYDYFEDKTPMVTQSTPTEQPLQLLQSTAAIPPPIDSPSFFPRTIPTVKPIANSSTKQNSRQNSLKEKKNKKWQKFNKLKENEKLSPITYGQYKQQMKEQGLTHHNLTSTPTSNINLPPIGTQIPPEIDLNSTARELGLDSDGCVIRNNSFKKVNRIGVSSEKSDKSKAITYIQREEEDDSNEYIDLLNQTKIPKRGLKARFESQKHFELTALQGTSSAFSDKNLQKCVLCPNEPKFRGKKDLDLHLKSVHNTDSSLKCGHCQFIGTKLAISSHSKLLHPNAELTVEKFIVHIDQKSSIGITLGSQLEKRKKTARKSTAGSSQATKGTKGALTQKIRESTYLGPLKNDVTQRKSTDQPFQRKYSRSIHSSAIRPKKRQKLITSDSESETEMQTEDIADTCEPQSDAEMHSDVDSESEHNYSDNEDIVEMPTKKAKKSVASASVAKKSTAKASTCNLSQTSITLTEEEIPTEYFCVFCTELHTLIDKSEAIEHYKTHLGLGYTCGECRQFFGSYNCMVSHWGTVHKDEPEMDCDDNMTDLMRSWIIDFLDNQIKWGDFAENIVANSTGINIECPLCVKAAKVCKTVRARSFDALWKVKLHICKHLNWFPMQCDLCEESDTMFPHNNYLLMKHLVDCHFTNCQNFYNISFRGQKPFNDMKMEQLKLIDKNFSVKRGTSNDIINSFFRQLMSELDLNYENQLKVKYNLTHEVRINVEPLIQVKCEPIEIDDESQEPEYDNEVKDEKQEDKKDVKLYIKTEFKTEIKSEFKTEVKTEVKDESKKEVEEENNDELSASGAQFLSRLYGDDVNEIVPIASTSGIRPMTSSNDAEEIVLSSDDES